MRIMPTGLALQLLGPFTATRHPGSHHPPVRCMPSQGLLVPIAVDLFVICSEYSMAHCQNQRMLLFDLVERRRSAARRDKCKALLASPASLRTHSTPVFAFDS